MDIEPAIWCLTDSELQRLCLAHSRGYMLLSPKPADDLVSVYTRWRLMQKRPAVFIAANASGSRLYVAVHSHELLPQLIEKAVADAYA